MTKLVNYIVARGHQGDLLIDGGTAVHMFNEGDVREASPADVKHLVDLGVLVEPAEGKSKKSGEKAEPAPANKAEGAAEKNKAAPTSGAAKTEGK